MNPTIIITATINTHANTKSVMLKGEIAIGVAAVGVVTCWSLGGVFLLIAGDTGGDLIGGTTGGKNGGPTGGGTGGGGGVNGGGTMALEQVVTRFVL
jgi:hypothetical protein